MRETKPNLTIQLSKYIGENHVSMVDPYPLKSYTELVEHVAQLAFLNKDNLLFFRGQKEDYLNKAGSTTLYPSIYRGDYLTHQELTYRFDYLKSAGLTLADLFNKNNIDGAKDVKRKEYIQWSILQHYEICNTPLLDITQSLRVACSFALLNNQTDFGIIYILGLPYYTNRISINSEHDLINIRLLSICPPHALRPYYQEGFLTGTTDITSDYEQKNELDFKNRLIAKFKIPNNKNFWGDDFKIIPKNALYPQNDLVFELCHQVKSEVDISIKPGEIGEFLKKWSEIEKILLENIQTDRKNSITVALRNAQKMKILDIDTINRINKLRRFRNEVVHRPKSLRVSSWNDYFVAIDSIIHILENKLTF